MRRRLHIFASLNTNTPASPRCAAYIRFDLHSRGAFLPSALAYPKER